jgi:hypothetical protein
MKTINLIPALLLALASFVNLHAQENQPTFEDFLCQFPTATLPYTFSAQSLQAQLESRAASKTAPMDWAYYQFLPELEQSAAFSSMPVHPEPVVAFETEQYHAVVYNLVRGLARGKRTYSVSVFTKDGQYVGTHFIAGVNPEMLTAVTIDQALNANVLQYKVEWANNYRENGHIGNKITGLELAEVGKFSLATAGTPDQILWANCVELNNSKLAESK